MNRGGRLLSCWYGAVCIAGLGFGLVGERRPFGENILAHPFIVYALCWQPPSSLFGSFGGGRCRSSSRNARLVWDAPRALPSSSPGTSSPRI